MKELNQLLTEILGRLVTHRADFNLDQADIGRATTKFTVRCHPADYGKLLGRQAATLKAVQYLVACCADGTGHSVLYEMVRPTDTTPKPRAPIHLEPFVDVSPFRAMLLTALRLALKGDADLVKIHQSDDFTATVFELDMPAMLRRKYELLPIALDVILSAVGRNNSRPINITVSWR